MIFFRLSEISLSSWRLAGQRLGGRQQTYDQGNESFNICFFASIIL